MRAIAQNTATIQEIWDTDNAIEELQNTVVDLDDPDPREDPILSQLKDLGERTLSDEQLELIVDSDGNTLAHYLATTDYRFLNPEVYNLLNDLDVPVGEL